MQSSSQIIITTNKPTSSFFYRPECPSCRPTNSVKALKRNRYQNVKIFSVYCSKRWHPELPTHASEASACQYSFSYQPDVLISQSTVKSLKAICIDRHHRNSFYMKCSKICLYFTELCASRLCLQCSDTDGSASALEAVGGLPPQYAPPLSSLCGRQN